MEVAEGEAEHAATDLDVGRAVDGDVVAEAIRRACRGRSVAMSISWRRTLSMPTTLEEVDGRAEARWPR